MTIDRIKLDNESDPGKLLTLLKEWDEAENDRYRPLWHEWEKNYLFFVGKHWLQEKSSSNTVTDGYTILEEDEDIFRPVDNYSAQLCEIKRSQIIGKNLRPTVSPNSDSKEDRDASILGRTLLRAKFDLDDEEEVYDTIFLIAQIFGIAWRSDIKHPHPYEYISEKQFEKVETDFYQCTTPDCKYIGGDPSPCKVCGNPNLTPVKDVVEEPILDEAGEQVVNQIPIMTHSTFIIDPFRVKVSPAATKKQITWITDTTLQPVGWVRDAYFCPQKKDKGFCLQNPEHVKKTELLNRGLKMSEDFKNTVVFKHSTLHTEVSTDKSGTFTNTEDTTVLRKSYFNPSKRYPSGRLIIWTDDVIVYDGKPDVPETKLESGRKKLKLWHGYNYFVYRMNPMRVEGIGFFSDLIPLNKKLNSYDAIVMEHLEKMATPTQVEFANVIKNEDDATDGIIKVNGIPGLPNGGAPFFLNVPQMANDVYALRTEIKQDMKERARVTDIIQGLHPPGVDTYRGQQLLKDSADSSEATLYNRWYKFFRSTQQLKLAILQECLLSADEELMDQMEIIRQNEGYGQEEIAVFTGQDLRNNLNVSVEETDYATQTTSAQNERIRNALGDQLLMPEQAYDPLTQLQIFRDLGMESVPLPKRADIEKTERIIRLVESGNYNAAQLLLKRFDDKPLQIRVLTNWMKSAKFEALDPKIQDSALKLLMRLENELLLPSPTTLPPSNESGGGSPQPSPAAKQ